MSMTMKKMSIGARIFIVACAMILCWMLTGSALTVEGEILLNCSGLHESITCSDENIDRIENQTVQVINRLAEQYGFDPGPVREIASREAIRTFTRQCTAWWMKILREGITEEAPAFQADEIIAVVRADTGYQNTVPSYEQRSVARDKIAYVIEKTVTGKAFPLRAELVNPALEIASRKVDLNRYLIYLPWIHIFCILTSILILGAIVFASARRPEFGNLCIGAAFNGCAILLMTVTAALLMADLPGMIRATSADVAANTEMLIRQVVLHLGLAILLNLGVGIGLTRHAMKGKQNKWEPRVKAEK